MREFIFENKVKNDTLKLLYDLISMKYEVKLQNFLWSTVWLTNYFQKEYIQKEIYRINDELLKDKICEDIIQIVDGSGYSINEVGKVFVQEYDEDLYYEEEFKYIPFEIKTYNFGNFGILEIILSAILDAKEFKEYLNYTVSKEIEDSYLDLQLRLSKNDPLEDIDLPKKNEITESLSLICYYQALLKEFDKVEQGVGVTKPKSLIEYRFNTILPESVPYLYDELHSRDIITAKKDHFIWAFGVGKDKPADFEQIIWKADNTLLAYLIFTICTNKNKWKVAEIIFGVSGLAQTFTNCKGNPRGKELINEIIKEIG